jgi:hypothetical protein
VLPCAPQARRPLRVRSELQLAVSGLAGRSAVARISRLGVRAVQEPGQDVPAWTALRRRRALEEALPSRYSAPFMMWMATVRSPRCFPSSDCPSCRLHRQVSGFLGSCQTGPVRPSFVRCSRPKTPDAAGRLCAPEPGVHVTGGEAADGPRGAAAPPSPGAALPSRPAANSPHWPGSSRGRGGAGLRLRQAPKPDHLPDGGV